MKHLKNICLNFVLILSLGFIAGCGSDSNSVATEKYTIAYTAPMMGEKEGKTVFTLFITDTATGNAAPGLTVTLTPVMHMTLMDHTTPVCTIVDNNDGTYTCTVYYLMMTMADQGWELTVTASDGSETTTASFTPTVGMAMPM